MMDMVPRWRASRKTLTCPFDPCILLYLYASCLLTTWKGEERELVQGRLESPGHTYTLTYLVDQPTLSHLSWIRIAPVPLVLLVTST